MNETSPTPLRAHIAYPPQRSSAQKADLKTVQSAAQLFRTHGILLLENSFDRSVVQTLRGDFLEFYASRNLQEIQSTCLRVGHERYMFTVQLKAPYLDPAVYAAPRVLPVVQSLLGKDCIIQSIGVVCAYPGAQRQHVHTDNPPLYPEAGGFNALCPPYALHVVVPLVDLDETTGTTAVWEGSHRRGVSAKEEPRSTTELERLEGAVFPWAKMGDCYFMDFRLLHCGTANSSELPRPILYLVYSRPWFEDRRNFDMQQPLLISSEEYAKIPQEHLYLFKNARPEPGAPAYPRFGARS